MHYNKIQTKEWEEEAYESWHCLRGEFSGIQILGNSAMEIKNLQIGFLKLYMSHCFCKIFLCS